MPWSDCAATVEARVRTDPPATDQEMAERLLEALAAVEVLAEQMRVERECYREQLNER